MKQKIKSILMRFVKGIIAGAVAQIGLVSINVPTVWSDFTVIINNLAIAGAFGGITGLLLALEKWASWKD